MKHITEALKQTAVLRFVLISIIGDTTTGQGLFLQSYCISSIHGGQM